jgi:NAD+ synthase (glutamine-hydrolysing)
MTITKTLTKAEVRRVQSTGTYCPDEYGFVRLACISPKLSPGDVAGNLDAILEAVATAADQGARIAVLPELCLTGYTCGDLFYQPHLLNAARKALLTLAEATARLSVAVVAGVPLADQGRLFNCAAFLAQGKVLGLTPKTFLPSTNEYYEERWFTAARLAPAETLLLGGQPVPFGSDLLFEATDLTGCVVGLEICEDLWAVYPPSGEMALAGATIIANPSASVELLCKAGYRAELVRQQSARCLAAYAYAAAGPGESTTDVVYSGHSMIAENGALLAEAERFSFATTTTLADVDVQHLAQERLRNSSFSAARPARIFRRIPFVLGRRATACDADLRRPLSPTPFIPADPRQRASSCQEIFSVQTTGLMRRLAHTGITSVVIGISGGLDSTLALLACVQAFDRLGLPRTSIQSVTMPGYGTTARTRANAEKLAVQLGTTLSVVPIQPALEQHFRDIAFDPERLGVTFENAQARERTQILMDLANKGGALVVGTGDLSEAALGWCTYNGDHISNYHVNVGIAKTLIRYLVQWCADEILDEAAAATARDICETPISPELLPLDAQDQLVQETEQVIGPYLLHDFFIFHALRHHSAPAKILFLAELAFAGTFERQEILKWLRVFYQRFFAQQFKRSTAPDGPKVGSVALSPRGDWRMPSDASAVLWLTELERLGDNEFRTRQPSARNKTKSEGL